MTLTATPTTLPEVMILEPRVHADDRGFFLESFNAREFARATGADESLRFVQDNHSRSAGGVLRGLHYQIEHPQGKLVRVTRGRVFDVAVDLRRGSPRLGRWAGVTLDAETHRQLWVPPGFAHGFVVLGDGAEVQYKTSDFWHPEHERSLAWDDAELGIDWPIDFAPSLAAKDAAAGAFADAELFD